MNYFQSTIPIGGGPSGDYSAKIGPGFSSPDLDALHAMTLRSKMAHAALIQGEKSQADADNHLLQTATPDELGNLYGAPRTPREARIQQVVQGDMNAKDRGAQMIPNWQTMQAYNKAILSNKQLAGEVQKNAQDRYFQPRAFQLDQDKFSNEKLNQAGIRSNAAGQLQLDHDKLDSENAFRTWQKNHQTQQDAYDAARLTDREFLEIQKNVANGEISAEDALKAIPNLSESQKAILQAHDVAFNTQAQQAQNQAALWNQRLQQSMPQGTKAVPYSFAHPFTAAKSAQPPTPEEVATAQNAIFGQFQKDKGAQKFIDVDPTTGKFIPLLKLQPGSTQSSSSAGTYDPVPAWLRTNQLTGSPNTEESGQSGPIGGSGGVFTPAPFSPASNNGTPQYLQGQDGYLYQVINGQPVKTNLRR